jgi:subtilisin family serine protease
MNPHRLKGRFFSLLALFVLVLGAFPLVTAQGPQATDKVEAALLSKLSKAGSADFIVRFAEQADLSPAYAMDWEERGQFVYNTLVEVTERTQGRAKDHLDRLGLAYQTFIAGNDLYVYGGDLMAANALAELPEVASIRATRTFSIGPLTPADVSGSVVDTPQGPATWGILDAKADQFWGAFGVQGDGIVVANIDTGVQWDHPALVNQYPCQGNPGNAACWRDPTGICGGTPCDNNGHGSHTMGTMVASDAPSLLYAAGMAPNAQWIACKGCATDSCEDAHLLSCADWVLAPGGNPNNRPHVLNNSWGGPGCDAWYRPKVDAWRAAGIFPAFSAGNAGELGCGSVGTPGDYQVSFATAAHDPVRAIAYFSSRGPSCFGHEPYTKPNISAPGVAVCSTVPHNDWDCFYSGTSMASPHTAGAVALLWSCNPGLIGQIDATFQTLQNTADPPPGGDCGAPPDAEGNYTFGYGYLNALAAGQQACAQPTLGILRGRVFDHETSDPVVGATVLASGATGAQATTDPNGWYEMNLQEGAYDVTASKTGYFSETKTVSVWAQTTTRQDFHLYYRGEWTLGPDLPDCFGLTRFDAEFFPGTGKVYVLGGRYNDLTTGNIFGFDPVTGVCADTGEDMPVPISNYTANLINDGSGDLLCTFGGRPDGGGTTTEVQCYDPNTNTATVVNHLPAGYGTYLPGAQVVVDNVVYVFGGFDPVASPWMTAVTYAYDPVTNSFAQLGNLSLARSYLMAAAVDGKVFAFGGDTFDGSNLIATTRAEVLDPGVGTWDDAAVADLPAASGEGQAFGFDSGLGLPGHVVLAGGGQWPGETAEALVYDVASNSYDTTFPDLIHMRRNHAGVFVPLCSPDPRDGLPGMWVFGGRQENDTSPYQRAEYFRVNDYSLPRASFTYTPTQGPVPLEVRFTSTYLNAVDPIWDFGDGFGGVGDVVTHTYILTGTYVVELFVSSLHDGCGSATATALVFAGGEGHHIYLPVIPRRHGLPIP